MRALRESLVIRNRLDCVQMSRTVSDKNQDRRSVSSIQTSIKLAVATSLCRSQTSCVDRSARVIRWRPSAWRRFGGLPEACRVCRYCFKQNSSIAGWGALYKRVLRNALSGCMPVPPWLVIRCGGAGAFTCPRSKALFSTPSDRAPPAPTRRTFVENILLGDPPACRPRQSILCYSTAGSSRSCMQGALRPSVPGSRQFLNPSGGFATQCMMSGWVAW